MQDSKTKSDAKKENPKGLVPCNAGVSYTIWDVHEERLEKLKEECPHVRIGGKPDSDSPLSAEYKERDKWGCLWHFPGLGIHGVVIEHPLDSWDKFDSWQPPSVEGAVQNIKKRAEESPDGKVPSVGTEHGFIFLRLTYLRGFHNFMIDVAEENPRIYELRDIVTNYWYEIVKAGLDCGATHVSGADDLGMQEKLPMSPKAWRKLLKPSFSRIFGLARECNATVSLHTDGYIVDVIPDLIEMGVTSLNPQDLVNGLDNLEKLAKGKVHIALDIDRQNITVFGTPEEIDAHIKNCIRILGSPEGGLSLGWGVYPGTPIQNIEATARAMEKYHDMWAN